MYTSSTSNYIVYNINHICLYIINTISILYIKVSYRSIILTILLSVCLISSYRVVSDEHRALALGLQSAIWRIFGAVPGPLLFGYLFDLSCVVWQEQCDRHGNCWVYHTDKLSIYATSVAFPCVTIGGLLFLLAVLTITKEQTI